jgi:uncharacterized protein YrrD
MFRYEQIKGLPVMAISEGKALGTVDDLYVDPDAKRVRWLRLHSGGLFGDRRCVMTESVHGIGVDAVTIKSEADVRSPEDVPEAEEFIKANRRLIGTDLVTEAGRRLGKVNDYDFDTESFAVMSLLVSPGMDILGQHLVISADKVITIGEDVIIASADAVPAPEPEKI